MNRSARSAAPGKTTVVVYGNRKACSACSALNIIIGKNQLARILRNAVVVDADASNAAMVRAWRPKLARVSAIPVIAVFDASGKRVGQFVCRRSSSSSTSAEKWTATRPWSAAGVAARVAALCSDCCVDCGDTPAAPVCPTCGQAVSK